MRYVIMADGAGVRWDNHGGEKKHMLVLGGESLLARTVRLVSEADPGAEIVITSHDPAYEIPGARRHEPLHNYLEVDRFTAELIQDHMCFLYGDTWYTREAIGDILRVPTEDLMFVGNQCSIVAVRVENSDLFREHVERVRRLYQLGEIHTCKGWQVYHSWQGMALEGKAIGEGYLLLSDETQDFNTPRDLMEFTGE